MFVNSIVYSSICLSYVRSWAVCTGDFIYSWGFVLDGVNWFYVVLLENIFYFVCHSFDVG